MKHRGKNWVKRRIGRLIRRRQPIPRWLCYHLGAKIKVHTLNKHRYMVTVGMFDGLVPEEMYELVSCAAPEEYEYVPGRLHPLVRCGVQ